MSTKQTRSLDKLIRGGTLIYRLYETEINLNNNNNISPDEDHALWRSVGRSNKENPFFGGGALVLLDG